MDDEIPVPNLPLSAEEAARVSRLSVEDLGAVDAAVLSCAHSRWRKVAMVISLSMEKLEDRYPGFSDVFYAQRVRSLVECGKLESNGDLSYMRFSEVRVSE
jgi:hypothetical protein